VVRRGIRGFARLHAYWWRESPASVILAYFCLAAAALACVALALAAAGGA
jgi:hypothetical protein